ncbi:MAG: hypothetical protein KY396_03010, partial [Actinobacteria bacterium]|nr:hypothetical protein [Actinomycetota bacterium]
MTRRRLSGACLIVLAALVLAPAGLATPGKPLPALVEAPRDALTRALERGRISEATYALERAISLFDRRSVAARYGSIARPDGREATLVLRDLAIRLDRLRGTERKRGEALLARPTLGASDPSGNGYTTSEATPVCGDFVCVHYVATTPDASTSTFAGEALQVFDDVVWPTQVTTMGYRAPKSDITSSPQNGTSSADPDGSQFDVYLTNLGDDGIYGYCTTDDPNAPVAGSFSYPHYDMSAYCVLDNGYTEFVASTGNTALENLQVTAAHEFQHAVQFAYDALEDPWVMEATATWIEDELFDAVDDNLQYLPDGPLGKPAIPLDKFTPTCCHVYGDWIFFRFLSEQFGAGTASDPTIVRRVWERADGSAAGPDDHSIQAVKNVLAARGSAFTNVFAMFGWVN